MTAGDLIWVFFVAVGFIFGLGYTFQQIMGRR